MPHSFLVVDDSDPNHQMYKLVFGRDPLAGSIVYYATNAREGYTLLAAHPEIVVVFVDLNMPGTDGLEFLARRRAENLHPRIPIVLVTEEATPEDEDRALAAGAWDQLRKPFQPVDLDRIVAQALILAASRPK